MPSSERPAGNAAEQISALDLSARIRNKHGGELNDLRAALTAAPPLEDPRHLGRRQHRLGTLPSFENANVHLTIVAETVELGWFAVGPAPAGTCLTVSIAAHRKESGIQTSLSLAESDAWLKALFGSSWMPHAYRCGCSTGAASESVVSYRLFLDSGHRAIPKPIEVLADACRPLTPQVTSAL